MSNLSLFYFHLDIAAFTLGEVVRVRPSKIIAGQDPERTNEFLQLLGTAILNKVIVFILTIAMQCFEYQHCPKKCLICV